MVKLSRKTISLKSLRNILKYEKLNNEDNFSPKFFWTNCLTLG